MLMSHTFHSKSQTILIGILTIKSPLVTYIYICHRHVHAKTEAIRGDDSLLNNYTANGVDEKPSLYEQTLYIYTTQKPLFDLLHLHWSRSEDLHQSIRIRSSNERKARVVRTSHLLRPQLGQSSQLSVLNDVNRTNYAPSPSMTLDPDKGVSARRQP